MVDNDTKVYQKTKNNYLLSANKILSNEKRCLIIIIKNYYLKKG